MGGSVINAGNVQRKKKRHTGKVDSERISEKGGERNELGEKNEKKLWEKKKIEKKGGSSRVKRVQGSLQAKPKKRGKQW